MLSSLCSHKRRDDHEQHMEQIQFFSLRTFRSAYKVVRNIFEIIQSAILV